MGARQSFQQDFDRRPRSNSSIGTGIEVHSGPGRRQTVNYQRDISIINSDLEEEAEDTTARLASLGIFSNGVFSSASSSNNSSVTYHREQRANVCGSAASAPHGSSGGSHRFGGHHHSGATPSNALRYSLRPGNRNSFLPSFSSSSGIAPADGASGSGRGARDRHSVPVLHLLGRDIKCPVCHKKVPSDDVEVHLVMCFTRPKIAYNDDVLDSNKGECAICLDEMIQGNVIARLPCLCIYHKICIDEWFKRKNTCPEHPGEE